jgi:CHAT domain
MSVAVVRINIASHDGQEVVDMIATRRGVCPLSIALPAGTLKTAQEEVSRLLRRFKDNVGSSAGPSTDKVKLALRNLFMGGLLLGGTLTRQGPSGMEKLRRFFVEALPDWATHPGVPIVQVEGPEYGFPFELLPVFETGDPGNMDDITAFARRFLGFSAAVRRVPYVCASMGGLPTARRLEGPPLTLSFAWYAQMPGARDEHEFFVALADKIELNGPWPTSALSRDTVLKALAEGLVDPRRRYVGQSGRPVQVLHFACHCDTGFNSPSEYELELSGGSGSQRITLEQLNAQYSFGLREQQESPDRPLVFLNACGATHQDPRHMYSWPEWFLQTGHLAVIGPETLVPDATAAYYARFFYQAVLANQSVGEALVFARRKLLLKYGNPLGLLYVLYGDPGITMEQSQFGDVE